MSAAVGQRVIQKNMRRVKSSDSPIDLVQIDGLVILKVIKHCHEEGGMFAEVQGALLGLVTEGKLEVTNCFPFPRHTEEDDIDDMDYQCVMIRHLRNVNVDHLHVGWYQSNPYGSSLSKLESVDAQYMYQTAIEESVVMLYDPVRTQRGFLSLKAYRLTNLAIKLCKEGEFTVETLRSNQMSFDKFFEEIPIRIRNSYLITSLMCGLEENMQVDEGKQFLDMGTVSVLEKSLLSSMKCVEDVSKWANYQKQVIMKQQQIQKENAARLSKGEPPLTEEEMNKIVKPLAALQRLECLLNYCQTLNYCQQSSSFASQSISKLFLAKALQQTTRSSNDKN
ncbi:JAB1 ubiquitin protease-like protein [Leptotrombidium deliense]|uniref:Eukaryotic translation initiation factor 3 subunit H n=1 Tax=Leptotrombidium deliense TaxID=299467 RepID=A0A443SEQ5_9ACAR|nr:JAB1 ubiquitin protease-like protein [Leptotrombidium deliense]